MCVEFAVVQATAVGPTPSTCSGLHPCMWFFSIFSFSGYQQHFLDVVGDGVYFTVDQVEGGKLSHSAPGTPLTSVQFFQANASALWAAHDFRECQGHGKNGISVRKAVGLLLTPMHLVLICSPRSADVWICVMACSISSQLKWHSLIYVHTAAKGFSMW